MIPEAYISHRLNQRIRIKIPSKRGHAGFFASVEKAFSGRENHKERVEVNPYTASALFLGRYSLKTIAEKGRKAGLFDLQSSKIRKETLLGTVRNTFKDADKSLLKFSGGELDIPSVIFLGLVGHGLYQFVRGNLTGPPWYTAFWYALGVFSRSGLSSMEEIETDLL
jgi:hypothetical protein